MAVQHWNGIFTDTVFRETIRYESSNNISATNFRKNPHDALENIIDIREYDVPYYVRCAIDLGNNSNHKVFPVPCILSFH